MPEVSLTKYRENFIKRISVYPRSAIYELRENKFEVAKKFFGEEIYKTRNHVYENMTVKEDVYFWQYHLAKLILSDDVMDYLETFKNKNK